MVATEMMKLLTTIFALLAQKYPSVGFPPVTKNTHAIGIREARAYIVYKLFPGSPWYIIPSFVLIHRLT